MMIDGKNDEYSDVCIFPIFYAKSASGGKKLALLNFLSKFLLSKIQNIIWEISPWLIDSNCESGLTPDFNPIPSMLMLISLRISG